MQTLLNACLVMALWVVASPSMAQIEPVVRVDVTPAAVRVGEPVALTVTVLGPTWFTRPPVYPSFELANAITRLPPDSSYPTGEDIDGERWSGIVRNYQVYPLIGAGYRLDGQVMSVTYADPETRKPLVVDVEVPEIAFTASVPAGAETLDPYIAGRSLALKRVMGDGAEELEAGDALVVRYVAELDGLPALFLPPLVEAVDVPGVSVYADQPLVEEGPPARRSETLTYVFDSGGEFEIPGREIEWWNTETQRIETASVPPLVVSVTGPPPATADAGTPVGWFTLGRWLVLLLVAAWLLSRLAPRLAEWWWGVRGRYRNSETHAFRRLRKDLRANDPRRVYDSLVTWLDRIAPGMDIRLFARHFGDRALQEQLERVSQSLYRDPGGEFDVGGLEQPLIEARRRAKRESLEDDSSRALPPLNP